MSRDVLGKRQIEVLQIILRKRGQAYGGGIFIDLFENDETMSLPQIYGILSKLSDKGFVTSTMSEPVAERGGRRKKLYAITGEGQRALSNALARDSALAPNGGWVAV